MKPWNVEPTEMVDYASARLTGEATAPSGLAILLDIAGGIKLVGKKAVAKGHLVLPKQLGIIIQIWIAASVAGVNDLEATRACIRHLSLDKQSGGFGLVVSSGVLQAQCLFNSSSFRPISRRILSARFQAKKDLGSEKSGISTEQIWLGGEVKLKLDLPIPETQSFWEAKRSQ